jgi:hypothetical protein
MDADGPVADALEMAGASYQPKARGSRVNG